MPSAAAIPADAVSLADYERIALGRLDPGARAYVAGAAADGVTARRNEEAFATLRLAGRVLADMGGATTATTLLGMDLPAPILVAPTAFHRLVHPDGEAATALGAAAMGACLTVSTQASMSLEAISGAASGPLWFQLYLQPDRADSLSLVRRAEAAGYRAIVVTADAPVSGIRNEEARAGFRLPPGVGAVNLAGMTEPPHRAGPGESPVFRGLLDHAPRWADIAWLTSVTRLPVLVKGIMATADAELALRHGAAGIIVSNHGGRTLDTLPASIEALPSIAATVAGRVPVLLDGGIRRGTDVLKALALGASAVMLGRPILHGLATAGAPGVAHVLAILRHELEVAMTLTGCRTPADIDATVLWRDR